MGCIPPAPRVCRVRCLATGIPEEWLPDLSNQANRTRLTGRLVFFPGRAKRDNSIEDQVQEETAGRASDGVHSAPAQIS